MCRELESQIIQFAAGLQSLGLGKGDKVSLMSSSQDMLPIVHTPLCRPPSIMEHHHMVAMPRSTLCASL